MMLKKKKTNVTVQGISSLEMLMRVLLTRPSGLTGAEVAKRTAFAPEKTQLVTVMRDGFLREVSAGQLVIGDVLVLAANEKAPVAVVTMNHQMAVVAADFATQEALHGVVVDPRFLTHHETAKVRIMHSVVSAVVTLLAFGGLLAMNEGAFVLAMLVTAGFVLRGMLKIIRLVVSNNQININQQVNQLWVVDIYRLVKHLSVEPMLKDVRHFLVHAGNAEIPQQILA